VICYVFLHPIILFSEVSILLLLVFRKLEIYKLEQSVFNFIISQLQGLEMKCLKKLRYLDIAQESVEITLVFTFSLKYSQVNYQLLDRQLVSHCQRALDVVDP
jgi:hypothetical protein